MNTNHEYRRNLYWEVVQNDYLTEDRLIQIVNEDCKDYEESLMVAVLSHVNYTSKVRDTILNGKPISTTVIVKIMKDPTLPAETLVKYWNEPLKDLKQIRDTILRNLNTPAELFLEANQLDGRYWSWDFLISLNSFTLPKRVKMLTILLGLDENEANSTDPTIVYDWLVELALATGKLQCRPDFVYFNSKGVVS